MANVANFVLVCLNRRLHSLEWVIQYACYIFLMFKMFKTTPSQEKRIKAKPVEKDFFFGRKHKMEKPNSPGSELIKTFQIFVVVCF